MIENMQPGSVIYDAVASQGGNAVYTKTDETVEKMSNDCGRKCNTNKLPCQRQIYMKNLFNLY